MNEPNFQKILKGKTDYYGKTEAAYEFAAEEYARQLVDKSNENDIPSFNDRAKRRASWASTLCNKISKIIMGSKIPYTIIKKKTLFTLKVIIFGVIILCSSWIWLPIIIWKMGLILSDNFVKYFIDDK